MVFERWHHDKALSQLLEEQVPVDMLEAVVPIQDAVLSWYLLESLQHEINHILEVPRVIKKDS